jgi:hypothetical protein
MYFKQNKVVITSLNVTQIGLTRKFLPERFHEIGSRRFRFRRPSSTFPAATAWRSSSWSSRPRPCRRSGSSLTTWPGADPSKHDRTVFFLFVTALHHSASVVVVNGAGSKSLNLQYVHMWKMQLTKDFLWCALAAWSEVSSTPGIGEIGIYGSRDRIPSGYRVVRWSELPCNPSCNAAEG